MIEKGILKVKKTKKNKYAGSVIIDNIKKSVLTVNYPFKDDGFNNKECDVERENGQIVRLVSEGKVLVDEKDHSVNTASTVREHINKNPAAMNSDVNNFYDSFDIQKAMIPSDTRNLPITDIDNFNLKFNKAARYEEKENKFKFYRIVPPKKTRDGEYSYNIKYSFNGQLYKDLENNLEHCIKKQNMQVEEVILRPDWRIASGIGSESVYEVSLLLHHIYGIPYLSGQSIKGVVRNYIIAECFDSKEDDALNDIGFRKIFGAPKNEKKKIDASEGAVCFYDAFPISDPKIDFDVMNPHFTKYYSQGKLPTEYDNPIPIFFLTVSNTDFKFIVASKNKDYKKIEEDKFDGLYPLEAAKKYLVDALQNHGIGAKTSAGYGYMELLK